MINHVRTLLLNRPRGTYGADFPGEEFVPAGFRTVVLPAGLQKVRNLIFGLDPDRYMLNYRLQQLMPLLHTTELSGYLTTQDTRITYWPVEAEDLLESAFVPAIEQTAGPEGELTCLGNLPADESRGQMGYHWRVTVLSGSLARVERLDSPRSTNDYRYSLDGTISTPVPLRSNAYWCRWNAGVGAAWELRALGRPSRTAADIVELLDAHVTLQDRDALFGASLEEPLATFRHLWETHPFLPCRLGGVLLALARQTDLLR